MAERAINQKSKAQFFDSFAPKSTSLDELVRDKLESGKFLLTKTGWTKIVAMVRIYTLFLCKRLQNKVYKKLYLNLKFSDCVFSRFSLIFGPKLGPVY